MYSGVTSERTIFTSTLKSFFLDHFHSQNLYGVIRILKPYTTVFFILVCFKVFLRYSILKK